MLEHGQGGHRGEFLGHHAGDQPQEAAGLRLRQILPRTVLGLDAMPRQGGGGAAGEVTVRRDQGGAALILQRLAQQQGDGAGLGLGIRRGLGLQPCECLRPGIGAAGLPGGQGGGGAQRLAEQPGARRGGHRLRPGRKATGRRTHQPQQGALAIKGMGGRLIQRIFRQIGGGRVLIMQHDKTSRQNARHHAQKRGGGGDGAAHANAGRHHQPGWRRSFPGLGLGGQGQDAGGADIEQLLLIEPKLPFPHHGAQENGGDLPMLRQFALDQGFQPGEPGLGQFRRAAQQRHIGLLKRDLVQQRGEFGRQPPGLFGRARAAAAIGQAQHQACQHALAAQRRHGGRQREQCGQAQLISILGRKAGQRPHAWQQHSTLALRKEFGTQRPGTAAGGQQDEGAGQFLRRGQPGAQPCGKRGQEGDAGGNAVDSHCCLHSPACR